MYLQQFSAELKKTWDGSLFTVKDAAHIDVRAKEYLHRLGKLGEVHRVYWGWYYIPEAERDVWSFLGGDKGFKVVVKQTAASIWNYDFVHRNVYRLAVEDRSYKKALEEFGKEKGWIFEVEYHDEMPYAYREVDGLLIEAPESCVASCIADWAFMDAFAILYFRRDEVSLNSIRALGRWKRISGTNTRVWSAVKYGCNLFNTHVGEGVFDVRRTSLRQEDIKELVEEAVEKVVEFA